MKKVFHLFILFLLVTSNFFAQKHDPVNLHEDENNLLNEVFDNYGNKYSLSEIIINKERDTSIQGRFVDTSCDSGIFRLHFTSGSGMIDGEHPNAAARRAVVCRVFKDVSDFVNSPLKTNGLNNRVEIWVRNFTDLFSPTSNVQAFASGFYNYPTPPTAITVDGGIIDNEIWKTIHAGVDSYTNVTSSITITSGSSNFYHGMLGINFNKDWNLDLNSTSFTNLDLYTVVLHELIHALGFASLISDNGSSRLNSTNYYTRYDSFLRNNLNQQLIIPDDINNVMYNNNFNNLTVGNLHACSSGTSSDLDPINCTSEINFSGTLNNYPVFNPMCFINGGSLSHFEDSCYPTGAPLGNNNYFVMSNALDNTVFKRAPTLEESQTLADIGYNLNNSYNGVIYPNLPNGINIAGVNDGISVISGFASYTYNVEVSANISTPTLLTINTSNHFLNNDFPSNLASLSYEGLQDVYYDNDGTTLITNTIGNINTTITFASTELGLHLLRYVPFDSVTGNRGNITYIYIYVRNVTPPVGNTYLSGPCSIQPSPCNLVTNGDFENFVGFPNLIVSGATNSYVCGWNRANNGTPDFFRTNHPFVNNRIPCNVNGEQTINNTGQTYIGLALSSNANENISTLLASPLLPNKDYKLSFDVSLAENSRRRARPIQIYLRNGIAIYPGMTDITTINSVNEMLFNTPVVQDFENWTTIEIEFNTGNRSNLDAIYIGGFNNSLVANTTLPGVLYSGGCSFIPNNTGNTTEVSAYYYMDNIKLIEKEDSNLNLPTRICLNEIIQDLTIFLNPAPAGGTFSGIGVTGNTFNATTAQIGTHIITYTYTTNNGCVKLITDSIEVTTDLCSNCGGITTIWNGTSWSNGIPTLNDDVIINGNYDTTLNGDINACNLIVVDPNNLIVQSGDFVTIQNNLTVQPNATFEIMDDGSLVQINDSGVNTGNITHRRSVMMRRLDYVYWSSPVTGFNTNSISPNTPTSVIWKWNPTFNNSNNTQGNWNNAANETMIVGKGYIVRGPSDFPDSSTQEFTSIFNNGVPHNGIINKSISRGNETSLGVLTSTDGKSYDRYSDNYNLIGNPYPSSIDAIDFLTHPNNNNIQGRIFLWTHGTLPSNIITSPFYQNFVANYTTDDYITYNQTGSQSGPNTFNGKIASGQGFMVLMEDGLTVPEDGTMNVTFNNSMRSSTNDNSNFFRNIENSTTINSNESNRMWLDLVNTSNNIDRTLVGYMSEATNSFDRMFDATLIAGNIYSLINSDKMIIQGKALPFNINDEVPLGVKLLSSGEYKIALYAVDGIFESEQNVYLKDNLLNVYHNLKTAPYSFTSTAGNYNDRFKLVYIAPNTTQLVSSQCNTTLPALNTIIYANLVPNAQSYNWIIKNNETNITHSFTTTGRSFQLTNASLGFPTNFVKFGSTYTISVRVRINDVYQAFGNDCVVTTPNIPITQIQCPYDPLTNIDTYINANINNYATAYRFEVKNLTTNQVGHIDRSLRNFMLTSITDVAPSSLTPFAMYNTQYSVKVALLVNGDQGDYSEECIVTTPNIPITQIQCPSDPLPTINSYINANINNYATVYRFEVKNLTTNQVGHIDRSLRNFMLTSITDVDPSSSNTFATFNTQYSVKVALLVNGNQGDYSEECIVTTPNIPIIQIQCPSDPLPTINSYINANINNYASAYRFEVKNLTTNQVGHIDRSLRNFMLTSITDVAPSSSNAFATYNTQYSVKVALLVNGDQGDYSEECIIETPSTYSKTNNYVSSDFKAVPIPNPFSNEFSIQIKSKSDELITIKVYDMIGKLLDNYVAKTENIGELHFGRNYPAGFYNIIITQGNNVEKLKIIKK